MMRDALERKKAAVLLLASAQSDVETQASFMIEERGLDETIRFQHTHYDIGDQYTAVGKFITAISCHTISSLSAKRQDLVSVPILSLFSMSHCAIQKHVCDPSEPYPHTFKT